MKNNKKELIQWHPAFFADIQIELDAETENLLFENEHQLSKKPMAIDVLIIKKISEKPVKKNIGRIFRKYNIVEYKSPTDYLSADDFYKVYGYACFYKADTGKEGEIPADELTITFVCGHYPREMLRQVNKDRGISAEQTEDGIYYIKPVAGGRLWACESMHRKTHICHANKYEQKSYATEGSGTICEYLFRNSGSALARSCSVRLNMPGGACEASM